MKFSKQFENRIFETKLILFGTGIFKTKRSKFGSEIFETKRIFGLEFLKQNGIWEWDF